MGVVKLPLSAASDLSPVDASYLPNHHIFYVERVADVSDTLPKWTSFPEGDLVVTSPAPLPPSTVAA